MVIGRSYWELLKTVPAPEPVPFSTLVPAPFPALVPTPFSEPISCAELIPFPKLVPAPEPGL